MSLRDFMKLAIEEAKIGGTPYGCVIVKDNKVIVQAYNTSKFEKDPTAQAEINAVRKLSALLSEAERGDCTLFSTCEPTPMGMSAIVYAGVKNVVYGVPADKLDGQHITINVTAKDIAEKSNHPVKVKGGKMLEECLALFHSFSK